MLISSPQLEAKTAGDLIKLARESPSELAYGSFGTGSINHLAVELLQSMAGIRANHFRIAARRPAMTDLIASRIQFTIDGPAALPFIRAGTVKLLGVGSRQRWGVFPDAPTISECGVPGLRVAHLVRPVRAGRHAGTVVDYLNSKLNAGVGSRTGQGKLGEAGR